MTVLTLDLPAMYGDHHVVEVRRILLDLDGVRDVYASSGFRVVEIDYNAKKITKAEITEILDEAGYLGELPLPQETDVPANESDGVEPFFRHTESYAQTSRVVSFGQKVAYEGRPLWPCPGMKPATTLLEEE